MLGDIDGNEGNFEDGIWVQEVVNAVENSHHERRWVSLPLTSGPGGPGRAAALGSPGRPAALGGESA